MQCTISFAKLTNYSSDIDEINKFMQQIETHGWCRINELTTTTTPKPTESIIRQFFNQNMQIKKTYSNAEHNIGYICSSTDERLRALTGKIYNNTQLDSDTISNKLCNIMDTVGLKIFKIICKHIIKQDWIKISSQNEICLTRNYFYSYKLSMIIASHWSNHIFICDDIILLISRYYAAKNKKRFNYGMLEAIQYNKQLENSSFSVKEHFDVGFCVFGLGETCQGLQLFDRIKNEYINADFNNSAIYVWLGVKVHELCNGRIPVGLHRVKWNIQNRISYLYEICIGQQIQSLSFSDIKNIKQPYKCLKIVISPFIQQQELLENVIVKKESMVIYVKSLNGNKNKLTVDVDCTVKGVKIELQIKEGIPAERLRIIFKGKLLNDTDVLRDKGVEPGMTLHSAIMLR
eukprot:442282_1